MIKFALPRGHRAYRISSGRIYLDLRQSPMMLARALGGYEPETHAEIAELLEPGDVFVDIGAAVGDFSLFASGIVGPTGRVLAIEPEPGNAHWLRRSLEASECENVEVVEAALDEREGGVADLHLSHNPGCHTLVELPAELRRERDGAAVQSVAIRSLDALVTELRIEEIALVKIDVEGWEMHVLLGAERTLASNQGIALLIELHPHLGVDPAEVHDFLRERGFSVDARERHGRRSPTTAIVAQREAQ